MIDGLGGREEAGPHAIVHIVPAESYPVFLPASRPCGMIGVPLTRKEQKEVALLKPGLGHSPAVEHAAALDDVEQLILRQYAPFLQVEVVAVCVPACGIGIVLAYLLITYRRDGEPSQLVAVAGQHIFTCLHSYTLFIIFLQAGHHLVGYLLHTLHIGVA